MAYEGKRNKGSPSYLYLKKTRPPLQLNDKQLTQTEEAKYLGMHLDLKLTWRKHILKKENNQI